MPNAERPDAQTRVIIVGGGFAGVACAAKLGKDRDLAVTLIDRNDYHQFQPLLYQVATYQLARRATSPTRWRRSRKVHGGFEVKQADVVGDRSGSALGHHGRRGRRSEADYLVLAAGSQAVLLQHARARASTRSRSTRSTTPSGSATAILAVFDDAAADPSLIDEGALEFVDRRRRPDRRRGRRRDRRR